MTTSIVKYGGTGLLIAMLVSGCGQGSSKPNPEQTSEVPPPADTTKPVNLVLLQDGATMTDDEFQTLVLQPIKAKYPNVSVELQVNTKGDDGIKELIASGSFPDIVLTTFSRIAVHRSLKTSSDLTEYVKQGGMDLGRFDSAAMDSIRYYSEKNQLSALPFSLNFLATFYNKDLFDTFGIPYPKDGMTWDDALDLAKRFSRNVNGVQYRGAMMTGLFDLSSQLTLPYLDPNTGKVKVTTDGWKRVVTMLSEFHKIPGNKGTNLDHFMKDQTVGMMFSYDARFLNLEAVHGTQSQFNWDVTQLPSYPEKPNVSAGSTGHFLMVSSLGKHKSEAFQAISVLTSTENQQTMTKRGRFTSLKDPAVKALYGENLKSVKGKNIQGIFKSSFAPPFAGTTHDIEVRPYLNKALTQVIDGQSDVNTALREAEDTANKELVLTP
ncbi:ABC transporter substrate-binding protein [Paenibacillus hodogayensis]|uniref:ABC transporter substrate-binding protein n=1 Tax=Paenibacillus hodogayensis TaxID=279208 RepID=A0ABV5W682_9BACL